MKSFIVAAHRCGAWVFESTGPKSVWRLRHHLDHPEGRLRDQDIDTDRPGSVSDHAGSGMHAMTVEVRATEHLAERFARRIAELLRHDRMLKAFDRLVLVAPPSFLGQLRAALDTKTAGVVQVSLAKDLTQPEPETLRTLLASRILV